MIDHFGIKTAHFLAAKALYDAALAALGSRVMMQVPLDFTGGKQVIGYGSTQPAFWLTEADQHPGSGVHIAFAAKSRAEVDAFYQAALAAGGTDNGPPGLRPQYHPGYYGAFVLDPDGNNVEAVCHLPE